MSAIVIGLGETGLSCVRFLSRQDERVMVYDSRPAPPCLETLQKEFPQVPFYCDDNVPEFDANNVPKQCVVSPGASLELPLIKKLRAMGVMITGDLDLFMQHVNAPVVAVTGTNGKSTVVTWLGDVIQAAGYTPAVCGNIGWPMLEALQTHEQNPPYCYVLELSSFQLERAAKPCLFQSAVILNLSDDHQDQHKNFSDYLNAKQKIYHHCEKPVCSLDDSRLWEGVCNTTQAFYFSEFFSTALGHYTLQVLDEGRCFLCVSGERWLDVAALKVFGRHQWLNALVVMALAESMGLSRSAIMTSLKRFSGLPHRCQWVACRAGVNWYNDSKATNVGASIAAVRSFSVQLTGRLILLMGGDGKAADFSALVPAFSGHVAQIFVYGRDAALIEAALSTVVPVTPVASLVEAVASAARFARSGDSVLLSPACSSLDQFKGYVARGVAFEAAVNALLP